MIADSQKIGTEDQLFACDNPGKRSTFVNEKEDGQFLRNAKCLFNLFILHDPLIHKIILTMQD